ncbi:hypothetical protein H072_11298 [Dactylellina haptotyla CBS 200.50]|uniref:Peptidase A1 domain-containing protein n=1 Tax=Dactylellina haptotyla (strain CBS 200.50) TaxID=1284197 RepID=S8BJG1_DACHA|nr:hypothetical protein H072_11298 [Dactylellina haptotyla CBS 200.50]
MHCNIRYSKAAAWLLTAAALVNLAFAADVATDVDGGELKEATIGRGVRHGIYPQEIERGLVARANTTTTSGPATRTDATGVTLQVLTNVRRKRTLWGRFLGTPLQERQTIAYLQAIDDGSGGYDYILTTDESQKSVFDIRSGILVDDANNGMTFAMNSEVGIGGGPWHASIAGGDIELQFTVDTGTGGLSWLNPAFLRMNQFYAALCMDVDAAGTSSLSWKYDAGYTGCPQALILQATGGDLPAPTLAPTLLGTVVTDPNQSISGFSGPTSIPPTTTPTSSDATTVLPTITETGVTTSTITDTATVITTSETTSLVTITSCNNWGCSQWTSTTTQTSTTMYTQPCTTLPIPVPVSDASRTNSAWFVIKCFASLSVASFIGYALAAW